MNLNGWMAPEANYCPISDLQAFGMGGWYAPPELLFGYLHTDFIPRRKGCDLYMLGNLAAFLFSGVNVTALLFSHLDRQHHLLWRSNRLFVWNKAPDLPN